jgi:hypothetical protein
VQCSINGKSKKMEGRNFMTISAPISNMARFLNEREEVGLTSRDTEPIDDRVLADAEEEEFAELWASDRGNQGS